MDGKYASRVGDLSKLTLTGPDVKVRGVRTRCAGHLVRLEPDVPRRGHQTRGARTARGSGIGRRVSGSRRHAHWQRRVTPDDREDERQRPWLEGQQRARRELAVHRDRTGSGCCEGARAVDCVGDIREGRSARAERGHGDDHVPEHAARLRCHGKATGSGGCRARRRHLPPGPSGDSPPFSRGAHPGDRVANGAWQRCRGTLRQRSHRGAERDARERGPDDRCERRVRADVGAAGDGADRQRPQRRHLADRTAGAAESRLHGPGRRNRKNPGAARRAARQRQRDGHQRRVQELQVRIADREGRLQPVGNRAGCHVAAVPDGSDHGAGHRSHDAVPTRRSGARRSEDG